MGELAEGERVVGVHAGRPRRVLVVGLTSRAVDLVREVLESETLELDLIEAADPMDVAGRGADLVVAFGAGVAGDVRARAPLATVVAVLTEPVSTSTVRRLLEQGVKGVIASEGWPAALGIVCRAVTVGQICVPVTHRAAIEPLTLSLRERQVLALITQGLSNADIAKQLFLAESTVKSHAAAAFRRLGVKSRREAVALVLGSDDALRRMVLAEHRPVVSHDLDPPDQVRDPGEIPQ